MDEGRTAMRVLKLIVIICLLLIAPPLLAHVGSPGVIYQGKAGPYNILVNITPPDVIPGTANTSVYVEDQQVNRVSLQPIYWNAGEKGMPKSDEALQTNGTGPYQCQVWLMQSGVSNMKITIDGPLGRGTAIVPVMAVSTAQRSMDVSLFIEIAALLLLLGILMLTIIRSCISDAITPPGEIPKVSKKKQNKAITLMACFLVFALFVGVVWWYFWREYYRKYLYKSPLAHSSVLYNGQQKFLRLNIDSAWLRANKKTMNYVVPDHGKMMHLFLIRERTSDVFAHLHPSRVDSLNYVSALPDLPAGRYLLFGDIVRWNGFAETIRDTVDIPAKPISQNVAYFTQKVYNDLDDTYLISNSIDNKRPYTGKFTLICGKPGTQIKLADGSTATWRHTANETFQANIVYPLTFFINDPEGKPAKLQPYMGMAGHAVVLKHDAQVYVHLHPVGTYSMESQTLIETRLKGNQKVPIMPEGKYFRDSIDKLVYKIRAMNEEERNNYLNLGMKGMSMPMAGMKMANSDGVVTFPYAFPIPGNYRIWVEVKRNGQILNAVFDTVVE